VFDEIQAAIIVDVYAGTRISEQAWQNSFNVALAASAYAALAHGTADQILPFDATAKQLPSLIADLRLVTVDAGPHNIAWTHPEEVNNALLDFLDE